MGITEMGNTSCVFERENEDVTLYVYIYKLTSRNIIERSENAFHDLFKLA